MSPRRRRHRALTRWGEAAVSRDAPRPTPTPICSWERAAGRDGTSRTGAAGPSTTCTASSATASASGRPRCCGSRRLVDRRIGDLESVRRLTGTAHFSGMVAARGRRRPVRALRPRLRPRSAPQRPVDHEDHHEPRGGPARRAGAARARPGGAPLPAGYRLGLRHGDGAGGPRHGRGQRLLRGLRGPCRERVPPGSRHGLAPAGGGRARDREPRVRPRHPERGRDQPRPGSCSTSRRTPT